jgi:hypothetical protein
MNPQMTEPTPNLERYTPAIEAPEMETLAEVGGVSVTVEVEWTEVEPLETEPTPEFLVERESLPNSAETAPQPIQPSITVFDIPIEFDTIGESPQMPNTGLFVAGKSEAKPRQSHPAEDLNTAGNIESELELAA